MELFEADDPVTELTSHLQQKIKQAQAKQRRSRIESKTEKLII